VVRGRGGRAPARGPHRHRPVTGCRGRSEPAGLLPGSAGPTVAARAHCPAIVVRGDVADPLRRHHTGPETRSGALWLDPVPLPEPRRTASPRSEASAIDVRLRDRVWA